VPISFAARGILPPSALVYAGGPGDTATFKIWAGLRAYTSSSIGVANVIKLRENGAHNVTVYKAIAGGGLDLTTINAFRTAFGGTKVFVDTLYDQTGGGRDFVQTDIAKQPEFVFNKLGGLPGIVFISANQTHLISSSVSGLSTVQPYTFSAVYEVDSTSQPLFTDSQVFIQGGGAGSGAAFIFAGGFLPTATNPSAGNFHTYGSLVNGATSKVLFDGGTIATGNGGTSAMASLGQLYIGENPSGPSQFLDGSLMEFGYAETDLSANFASFNTQQRGYYGF
jgi:hypothetical protein